jgi:hypothetical protein
MSGELTPRKGAIAPDSDLGIALQAAGLYYAGDTPAGFIKGWETHAEFVTVANQGDAGRQEAPMRLARDWAKAWGEVGRLREALTELVRLKDLKEADVEAYEAEPGGEGGAKERAWTAARVVLAVPSLCVACKDKGGPGPLVPCPACNRYGRIESATLRS